MNEDSQKLPVDLVTQGEQNASAQDSGVIDTMATDAEQNQPSKKSRIVLGLSGVGLILLVSATVLVFSLTTPTPQEDVKEDTPLATSSLSSFSASASLKDSTQSKSASALSEELTNTGDTTEVPVPGDGTNMPDKPAPANGNNANAGTVQNGTGSGNTTGATNGDTRGASPDPNANKTWHPAWDEWVVDAAGYYEQRLVSAAWDEESGYYTNIFYDGTPLPADWPSLPVEAKLDLMSAHGHGYYYGWYSTGTIHHEAVYEQVWIPEQGHWVHHEGYWI